MTEVEWLACTDPDAMLEFLRGKVSDRKLRLFACACGRSVWHLLTDAKSRKAVEAAERYADGSATEKDLRAAYAESPGGWPAANLASATAMLDAAMAAAWPCQAAESTRVAGVRKAVARTRRTAGQTDCRLLRDLFNPFHLPAAVDAAVLAWSDGTLVRLAQAVYDERAFDRLPILADALEDAGCHDGAILVHCRGPGPHARGCWVVDLLLGKN